VSPSAVSPSAEPYAIEPLSGEPLSTDALPTDGSSAAPPPPAPPRPPPPPFADGADRRLEPGWIPASRYGALIFWSIVAGFGFLFLTALVAAGKLPIALYLLVVAGWFALTAAVLTLAWMWPTWEHARAGYRIRPDRIESWGGLVWRRAVSVPISRVQYTDVRQGPFERRHGIATLVVHTAGTLSSDVAFAGLPPALANEVRDWLVAQTGSDAV
jgi:hypothetical protein